MNTIEISLDSLEGSNREVFETATSRQLEQFIQCLTVNSMRSNTSWCQSENRGATVSALSYSLEVC